MAHVRFSSVSRFVATFLLCTVLVTGVTACSSVKRDHQAAATIADPLEPVNRGIFAFNNFVDIFLIEPVAKIYNAIVPDFARDGVQNFMRNLKSPLIVANSLLQGDFRHAGVATARFVINTTAGIGGLIDVAAAQGMPYRPEDFGQTLGVWGFGDGMYIVLPIIGPSSLRDGVGLAGDIYADPLRIWAFNEGEEWVYYTRNAVDGLDTRARLVRAVEDLRRNSLDYYATVRSAYAQRRAALIRNEDPDRPREQAPASVYFDAGWD